MNQNPQPMNPNPQHLLALAKRGIDLCRRGRAKQGFNYLLKVAERKVGNVSLPGVYYSYLGYGVARFQHRRKEGLALCRHAVKLEFYEPENFLNLARTQMLGNDRRGAIETLDRGLKIDPNHAGVGALRRELGRRRSPPLPFLHRSNPVNVRIGKVLASLRRKDLEDDQDEDGALDSVILS